MGKTTDQPDNLREQFNSDPSEYLQPTQQFTFIKDEMEWGERLEEAPALELLAQTQRGFILQGFAPRKRTYLARYIRVKRKANK